MLVGHTPDAAIMQSTIRRNQQFYLACLVDCSTLTIQSKFLYHEYPDIGPHQDDAHRQCEQVSFYRPQVWPVVLCHILWRLRRQCGAPVLSRDQEVMSHVAAEPTEQWLLGVYNEPNNSGPRPGLAQRILKLILSGCR
jgi:hypothetical protein